MANGKPLIFRSLEIGDGDNIQNNAVTTSLTDDDNYTIGNEALETLVEGGQTIVNGYNQALEVIAYDLGVLTDTNAANAGVQVNTDIPSVKPTIRMVGASGSVNVTISNVRVAATRPFNDGLTRDHVMIKATLTSTSQITVEDV